MLLPGLLITRSCVCSESFVEFHALGVVSGFREKRMGKKGRRKIGCIPDARAFAAA